MSRQPKKQPEEAVTPEKTLVQKLFWPFLIIIGLYVGVMAVMEAQAETETPPETEVVEMNEEEAGFFRSMIDSAVARADNRLDVKREELEAFEQALNERDAVTAERESEISVRYGSIVSASTSLQECALNALKEVSDAQPTSGS